MRCVVALGGNALLRRGESLTANNQRVNVRRAAAALGEAIHAGHQLIITHGNGPQVGLLALQAAAGPTDGAYPLDVLGAESEGMIGYMIEQELNNVLPSGALLATLLTQVRVHAHDPAFKNPTKPIGPVYDEATARSLASARRWTIAADGQNWRRVVASPEPIEILEARVIDMLARQGVTVICAGGGGIPVLERTDGSFHGVEAVIDKDFTSALLARQLGADMLIMLTDVDAVYLDFGQPSARAIEASSPRGLSADAFPEGSMRPKLSAAIGFASETGHPAAIGQLDDLNLIIKGKRGTRIDVAMKGLRMRAS